MSQTKRMSVVESMVNLAVGMIVALISQIVIFGLYDIPVNLSQNIEMTAWFTVVSFVRSYCLRRMFNRMPWRSHVDK